MTNAQNATIDLAPDVAKLVRSHSGDARAVVLAAFDLVTSRGGSQGYATALLRRIAKTSRPDVLQLVKTPRRLAAVRSAASARSQVLLSSGGVDRDKLAHRQVQKMVARILAPLPEDVELAAARAVTRRHAYAILGLQFVDLARQKGWDSLAVSRPRLAVQLGIRMQAAGFVLGDLEDLGWIRTVRAGKGSAHVIRLDALHTGSEREAKLRAAEAGWIAAPAQGGSADRDGGSDQGGSVDLHGGSGQSGSVDQEGGSDRQKGDTDPAWIAELIRLAGHPAWIASDRVKPAHWLLLLARATGTDPRTLNLPARLGPLDRVLKEEGLYGSELGVELDRIARETGAFEKVAQAEAERAEAARERLAAVEQHRAAAAKKRDTTRARKKTAARPSTATARTWAAPSAVSATAAKGDTSPAAQEALRVTLPAGFDATNERHVRALLGKVSAQTGKDGWQLKSADGGQAVLHRAVG